MPTIPNSVFDNYMKTRLSKNPNRLLFLFIGECYESDDGVHSWISLSNEKIAIMTRMSIPAIKKAISQLEEKKLIDVKYENGKRMIGVLCLKQV